MTEPISEKGIMKCFIDLDWVTYYCPCGANVCTRYMADGDFSRWMAEHKPHTSGELLERTTADGNRVYASPEPDRVVKL